MVHSPFKTISYAACVATLLAALNSYAAPSTINEPALPSSTLEETYQGKYKDPAVAGPFYDNPEEVYEEAATPFPPGVVRFGIGFGDRFDIFASLTTLYTSYFGITTALQYENFRDDSSGESLWLRHYGPSLGFVALLPNKTIFTPIAGLGPGYEIWKRQADGVSFDESSSLTLNHHLGVRIMLSRIFSLDMQSVGKSYYAAAPKDPKQKDQNEGSFQREFELRFTVSI